MFKKLILTVGLILSTTTIFAAESLAILMPTGRNGVDSIQLEGLWSMLETKVGGGYEVVTRDGLEGLLKENEFATTSDLFDTEKSKELFGKFKNVDAVLISSIAKTGNKLNVSLALINVQTAVIDSNKRKSILVNNFDELNDKIDDLLAEMELGRSRKASGKVALLNPIISNVNHAYLSTSMTNTLEEELISANVKMMTLKNITPILQKNKIDPLTELDPALFKRVGELLRADYLIQPTVTRYSITTQKKHIAISNRTVEKRIGNLSGSIKVISTDNGECVGSISFKKQINFSDIDQEIDTTDWSDEDYINYLIEAALKDTTQKIVKSLTPLTDKK